MKNISYIIPHYNSWDSLFRLLNTIELGEDDEIVIIDDCSTDSIWKKVMNLGQSNVQIKTYRMDKNRGAGACRNKGIEVSRSDWLLFADSDDYFVKEYRNKMIRYLSSNADIVYFKPTSTKDSDNISIRGNRHWYYEYLIDSYLENETIYGLNLMKYQMVVPWSKLLRREFVVDNNILYDETPVSNDVFFSTLVGFYSSKVEVSTDVIYCCVENSNSLTSDVSYEKFKIRIEIFVKQYKFLQENLESKEFKKMNLTGTSILLQSIKYKYTWKERLEIFRFMRLNGVKTFSLSWCKQIISRQLKILS